MAGYVSPGDIRSALRQVYAEVERVHRALHQHCQQRRACNIETLDGWGRFRAEWRAFYDNAVHSLWEQLWGSTMDTIERYQLRLLRWVTRLERGVAAFQAPDALSLFEGTRQLAHDEASVGANRSTVRLLWGVAGVGVLAGLGWVVVRRTRAEARA